MNYQRLESQIMNDEGFRARPYLDTEQIPTIGYGTTNILGHAVTLQTETMSAQTARQLLRADLYGAMVDAQALFPRLNEMPDVRQEVLVNMAYNLGRARLSKFINLRDAAERLDYTTMAAEMMASKWYSQVGTRALRLVRNMRTGEV